MLCSLFFTHPNIFFWGGVALADQLLLRKSKIAEPEGNAAKNNVWLVVCLFCGGSVCMHADMNVRAILTNIEPSMETTLLIKSYLSCYKGWGGGREDSYIIVRPSCFLIKCWFIFLLLAKDRVSALHKEPIQKGTDLFNVSSLGRTGIESNN